MPFINSKVSVETIVYEEMLFEKDWKNNGIKKNKYR